MEWFRFDYSPSGFSAMCMHTAPQKFAHGHLVKPAPWINSATVSGV
jgi:hypothetical protein